MAASTATHTGPRRPGGVKLWLALIAVIAAGAALAWFSAGSLRPEVTQSGLEFRVVKEGTGDPITDQDAAIIDYVLTGDDGNVIDSSQQHQQPQPFTTGSVFPGFAEAMRRMREGGQYSFKMPRRLAFEGPPPPGFPPTSSLTFDVRVRKIVRGGAAMMGMMPPQR